MKISPTIVYDTFWHFAYKRQQLFEEKRLNKPYLTVKDKVLNDYRFTNVYRASDRVSQYLIRNVIYREYAEPEELLFKILLFKIFNSIQTWEMLKKELNPTKWKELSYADIDYVLTCAREDKRKIYSPAYIMPSGKSAFGHSIKHRNHLALLKLIFDSNPIKSINKIKSLEEMYFYLKSFPTIGKFLAYQYAIDINYSELTNFDESEYVVAGPGADRGIRKCFRGVLRGEEAEIIKFVQSKQKEEFNKRNLDFSFLNGRELQLIDIQNIFCEVDKYARVVHPEIGNKSSRHRIKQKYRKNPKPIEYFYPPKWGLLQE
jgi:hypothetical protein